MHTGQYFLQRSLDHTRSRSEATDIVVIGILLALYIVVIGILLALYIVVIGILLALAKTSGLKQNVSVQSSVSRLPTAVVNFKT